ncbi:MAG: hypothetical protein U1F33_07405 [Alphaproteobacteria bacterium]
MIRRSTILFMVLAAVIAFGLFKLTFEVQGLETELHRLNRSILAEDEAIHVLEAEWSYLNEPTRLEALAKRHLALQAVGDARMRTVAELPGRSPGMVPVAKPGGPWPAQANVQPALTTSRPKP